MSRYRLARTTVRTRVLGAVLVLAGLALLIAGSADYFLQARRTDLRIDAALSAAAAAVREAARTGLTPDGEPIASTADLLSSQVEAAAPAPNQGVVAFLDDRPLWFAAPDLELRTDEELLAELAGLPTTEIELRTTSTAVTEYRYLAIPVLGQARSGTFVVVHDRTAELAAVRSAFRTYLLVATGSLVVIALVGWLVIGRLLSPLRRLRETADRISESDLTQRIPVAGRDDLAALAGSFNQMLDRLQTAFAAHQRLLDDMGTGLRTPLEMAGDRVARLQATDPQFEAERAAALLDLDHTYRLLGDLLTLAQSDRPDFLRRTPVNLRQLTDEILGAARRLGERQWIVEARAEAVVELDHARVVRAWMHLIENAVRFSTPGTRIAIGSAVVRSAPQTVQLWVEDEGAGLLPHERARVFERFVQGSAAAGAPGRGRGLGLAVVAAVAAAHHGSARWEPVTGPGARFVIELPVTLARRRTARRARAANL